MIEDYKDFDSRIRSLVTDAEEDVPQHIMDDVFAELDKKERKPVILPWMKWAGIGIVAAALTVGIFLWKGGNQPGLQVVSSTGSAVVQDSRPSQLDKQEVPEVTNIICPELCEDSGLLTEAVTGKNDGQISVPAADMQSDEDSHETERKDSRTNAETGESAVESPRKQTESTEEKADTEDIADAFHITDDDIYHDRASKVSITVGGDISSNGNPGSMNLRRGFYAPPSGIEEATYIEQTSKNSSYSIPVSFGMSARLDLGKRWGIGAGLNYTLLQRTFTGTYTRISGGKTVKRISSDIRQTLHYIGLPVTAYYDILQGSRLKLYAYAGGTAERGIANVYRIRNSSRDIIYKDSIKGIQFSADAGLGIEFKIVDQLGFYVNPGISYYFDCNQPVSIRTQQPLMMNFEIGMRVEI